MGVAVATQNTPMIFQMPPAEIHCHKKHMNRHYLQVKSQPVSQQSMAWPCSTISFHTLPIFHQILHSTVFNHTASLLPTQWSGTQLSSAPSSVTSFPLFVGRRLPTYHMKSAKSVSDLSSRSTTSQTS